GIPERDAHQPFATSFERYDVLPRGEDHLAKRHHPFFADGFTDHCEGLLTDFTIRHDVIGIVDIELVDFVLGHELVDLNDAPALDLNGFKLFRLDLNVFALRDLITLDDVVVLDLAARFRIHLL